MASKNDKKLKVESKRFYKKLFSFLQLNQALKFSGYNFKYISEMNEKEYQEYLISLEYLHQRGIIDLDQYINPKG